MSLLDCQHVILIWNGMAGFWQITDKLILLGLGYVKVSKFWLNSLELQLIQEEKPILPESKSLSVAWSGIILCLGSSKGTCSMCDDWDLCQNFWCAPNRYESVNFGTSFRKREYEYGASHHCRVTFSVSSDVVEGLFFRNDSVFI